MPIAKPVDKTYPIDKIIPNPRNDNIHPRSEIDMLMESYRLFQQPRRILVRKANRMIIAGHAVHQALKEAGATTIDVQEWDVDQRMADAFLIADNRLHDLSHPDEARRRSILAELSEDGFDFAAIGFLDEEVAALLAQDDELDVIEIDTDEVEDTFWVSIRGPLPQQAAVLQRLQAVMSEFEGVEVDLGTVLG
jgi:ParB-like chromosome segregation protein Spo0J